MRRIQRDIVGAFIFSRDNKLLLGKTYKGGVYADKWVVPGGGVDAGETKLAALKREILEETGIDISNSAIEEIQTSNSGESEKVLRDTNEHVIVEMKFFDYKVNLSRDSSDIELSTDDDFEEARWFSPSELKDLELSPPATDALSKLGYLPKT